jgi:hypothetical protein
MGTLMEALMKLGWGLDGPYPAVSCHACQDVLYSGVLSISAQDGSFPEYTHKYSMNFYLTFCLAV